ncbi:hypothetical protein [Oleiharenicola lentus]|uniref:hypothetical protein n=1 Tax=Oleiharenicola lentus TaxID=2508720 RepID=UPI003F66BE9C
MSFLAKIFRRRPRPKLDLSHPQVVALSARLRALHAMPISSKEEVAAWEVEAEKLRERLYEDYKEVYDSLPHEIEHYLVDVDIRAKDPGYAKYQAEQLVELLSLPEEMPNQSPEPMPLKRHGSS